MFAQRMLDLKSVQTRDIFNTYIYRSETDTSADIQAAGYFNESRFADSDPNGWANGKIEVRASDGYFEGFLDETGTLLAALGGGAYGVVYRDSANGSLTTVSSPALYFPCDLGAFPTPLDSASSSHFTSTEDGDLIYNGPSARFRWKWEGQGFVQGNSQEAVLLAPFINGVIYDTINARNQGDPFYSPWQSIGIIPLDDGDVVTLGVRNSSNNDPVGILQYFMELRQLTN